MTTLTPDYLTIDFNTLVSNLRSQLRSSDIFQDVDYEGSNISVLIELFAYIAELNTYYTNKLAKNQFIDTADVYNNVHRLANFVGYYPKGYISSAGTLTLTASGAGWIGKEFSVNSWQEFTTEDIVDSNGDPIKFASMETVTVSATSNIIEFEIPVRQGEIIKYTNTLTDVYRSGDAYSGSDLINNKLILPFLNFDCDDDIDDHISIYKGFCK